MATKTAITRIDLAQSMGRVAAASDAFWKKLDDSPVLGDILDLAKVYFDSASASATVFDSYSGVGKSECKEAASKLRQVAAALGSAARAFKARDGSDALETQVKLAMEAIQLVGTEAGKLSYTALGAVPADPLEKALLNSRGVTPSSFS